MELLVLAAALFFWYLALSNFLALCKTPDPTRTIIVFVYCFLCGLYLFYEGWPVVVHRTIS